MEKILEVKNLKKYFPIKKGMFGRISGNIKAVDDISFDLYKGETLGVVGESGSGKSTAGRSILRLIEPTSGQIIYRNKDITKMEGENLRKIRRDMQMIFQDPYASLNPRMSVGDCIIEPMNEHKLFDKNSRKRMAEEILDKVGLDQNYFYRYPHEFSGGQRQRIGIARALALNPEIIIADEPVSALDVSVQSQILNLFNDLKDELGLTYIFIAHDLSIVKYLSDRILVMYLGEIMEFASKDDIFNNSMHPYTKALISAIPIPDPTFKGDKIILKGDIPSPSNPPKGCKFSTRCPECMDICREVHPKLKNYDGHLIRCHIYSKGEGENC
ncbi:MULTISPECIES: ABC transporter ATP-binding protein [Tissierellales]|jgi:peptide/nickel transport system ATP-binding protein/oligopeptide transport system ATP-binding protein|uniref:Dipeptide ABC transporter ATP-binding protein n=1 Tax=Acidilutibacter cellobiosedens TaxID=2507161 RepID=A0A410QHC5_9FIRM|nr:MULTISPECIES: dipeptide ABC transporter ATP-binding protein [Tissierellales]QAT63274.1 dipeptide ABC transporter ATP-binding protein [Acidilutibacter cellobiosedens]SCL95817.1 Stage 0 sporulation protein KE [Sporanaerobacter sp. PP17-6a]